MRARLVLPLAIALVAVLAPAANGATRVGPTSLATSHLTKEPCASARCTYIQYTDGGATPAYVSPVSGVITRWELGSGSAGDTVRLRVLRPREPGAFSGQGTGLARTTEKGLNTFTGERVAVETGDSIGIDAGQGRFFAPDIAGALVRWWSPFLADAGGSSAPNNTSVAGHVLQLHVDIEPDRDGDRFGDETQDGCPGDNQRNAPPCATGPVNPILPVVSRVRIDPTTLRIGGRSAISFRLSAASRWTLTFEQVRSGHVRNGRCRVNVQTGRRCTVHTRRGSVSGTGGPGKVTLIFQGALTGGRSLPPGRYRVTVTARNSDGTSHPVRKFLTLLPKR